MRDQTQKTYIFSAYSNKESSRFNMMAHDTMLDALRLEGMTPVELDGAYKGHREESIGVNVPTSLEHKIVDLCRAYDQESYLSIDAQNVATLHFLSGESVVLGLWSYAPEHEALNQDAWTKLPYGEYRIVRPLKRRE